MTYGKAIIREVKNMVESKAVEAIGFMIPFDILTMTPEEFESRDSLLSESARKGEIIYCHPNPKRVQSNPKRVRKIGS